MPRNGVGTMSWPAGTDAAPNTTIESAKYNSFRSDLLSDLNTARPISAGGTGSTSAADARTNLGIDTVLAALIPPGVIWNWAGVSAPSGFLLCYGQAVAVATYPTLTTNIYCGDANNATANHGYRATSTSNPSANRSITGDFIVLPDCRGRVDAGKDDMGGTSANRLTNQTGGLNGDTLGATGGAETHTLTDTQMPSHTHTGSALSAGAHTHDVAITGGAASGAGGATRMAPGGVGISTDSAGAHAHTLSINSAGSDTAHNNVQPTIIFNKIIKV